MLSHYCASLSEPRTPFIYSARWTSARIYKRASAFVNQKHHLLLPRHDKIENYGRDLNGRYASTRRRLDAHVKLRKEVAAFKYERVA